MASRASDLLRASAMVVAGLVGGALFTALFRPEPRPAVVRDARAPDEREATATPSPRTTRDDVSDLRQRVAAVEAAAASAHTAREPTTPGVERPTLEQMRAFHEEHHAALLRAHAQQPPDPKWAAEAQATLARDLATVAGDRFSTSGVDCRVTTCTAKVQWDNYEMASKTYNEVVMAPLGLACRRDILLPEPADRTARYEATAFFDCEEARIAAR